MTTPKKTHILDIKFEKLFLILILALGSITLVIQPVFSVPDEGIHFKNAYSVFHNDANKEDFKRYAVPGSKGPLKPTYVKDFFITKKKFNKNPLAFNFKFKSIQYLPTAIGMLIGQAIYPSLGVVLIFGRIFNFILYVLGIYFAIKKAKFGQPLMAFVALLPMSIQQAASISYDVLFFISIYACFSLVTNLATRKKPLSKQWYIYITLIVILLFLVKVSALALGLYFITLPAILFGGGHLSKFIDKFWLFCNRYRVILTALVGIVFLLYLKLQFRNFGGVSRGLQVLINSLTRPDIKTDLDSTATSGIIGSFGWLTYRLPEWLVIIDFIFIALISLNEKNIILKTRMVVSSLVIYIVNIVMLTITMFFAHTIEVLKLNDAMFAMGEQGRYYTPFLICFSPIGIYLNKYIKVEIRERTLKKIFIAMVLFNGLFFILLTLLFYYTVDGGLAFLPELGQQLRK
ncbi:MAG: DUF2142 domain-containing protein [Streptococcaceae bacterium]|jgi:uncharacterized membrane protein|nr:DUF2142 domain-containing protein [Streptococcaceae bacterium]